MARDIDRKLRLTAALIGAVTRKDLAAAFRRANPATGFDLGRADKWLQGRAQPRQAEVYEDWAKVLGIAQPGRWIADSDVAAFLAEICARHERDPDDLRSRVERWDGAAREAPVHNLAGTFVCYSHAWSPYFRGLLLRGAFEIADATAAGRLAATYTEILPTGPMTLSGTGALSQHDLRFDVRDTSGSAQILSFVFFAPKPPASVLAGFVFGTGLIGPEAQPSMSRAVAVRLARPCPSLKTRTAYLPQSGSVTADLAELGLGVDDAPAVERAVAAVLHGGLAGGFDQIPTESYRTLVDRFDRLWFRAGGPAAAAHDGSASAA